LLTHRKQSPAALRFAERRKREDEAPRLSTEVPELTSLRLEIEERSGSSVAQPKHIRRVVVENAPALFLIPCGDPRCLEGGHDATATVMRALRAHATIFEGTDGCTGSVGSSACGRILHFEAFAEYKT